MPDEFPEPFDRPIVFYDGECAMCSSLVRFVLRRDPAGRLRFATLQSEFGGVVADWFGYEREPSVMFLLEGDRLSVASTAALRTARHLKFPWWLAGWLRVVPRPIRDWVYRFVAKRRYRWFGTQEYCEVLAAADRSRFLADEGMSESWQSAMRTRGADVPVAPRNG